MKVNRLKVWGLYILIAQRVLSENSQPPIWPDYSDIVIPPNIAPLNFYLLTNLGPVRVVVNSDSRKELEINSKDGTFIFPEKKWHALLSNNLGKDLIFELYAQTQRKYWTLLYKWTNKVAAQTIDPVLVYRRLGPLYNFYQELGIYQRNIETFEESPILLNRDTRRGCINCHTPYNFQPDSFLIQIRGSITPPPMLLVISNLPTLIARTAGYASWHPSGRLIAFSVNNLSLFFHTNGEETRDVFDAKSDIGIYWIRENKIEFPSPISQEDYAETWPSWSYDGRYLYFCRARIEPRVNYKSIRYQLLRVPFDSEHSKWGDIEVVVDGPSIGMSVLEPRPSPNGKWILFTGCEYGHFPIYRPESDLYILDLNSGIFRALIEINSKFADTWHCWSSNGRWIVFASKRMDGFFTRPFIAWFDEQGRFSKPFVLPQKDPRYYQRCTDNFNVPELIKGWVNIPAYKLSSTILHAAPIIKPDLLSSPQALSHTDETGSIEYP